MTCRFANHLSTHTKKFFYKKIFKNKKKFLKKIFGQPTKRIFSRDTFFLFWRSDLQVVCLVVLWSDLSQNRKTHTHNETTFFFCDYRFSFRKKFKVRS